MGENILVIEDKHLRNFLPEGVSFSYIHKEWLMKKLPLMYFTNKPQAETNEDLRQVIPYVVFMDSKGRIFTYQRTKKSGEQRLALQYSIGVGGHINSKDVQSISHVESAALFLDAAYREIEEEVHHSERLFQLSIEGIIYDNSNDVGKVHVGLIIIADCKGDVEPKEDHLANGSWMSLKELELTNLDLENWTKLVVQALKGKV